MCNFENGFMLCTCNEKSEASELDSAKIEYVWELRVLNKNEFAQGKARWSTSDIGKGLVSDWILLNLEDRNCFDFDYQPKEGDNLVMYNSRQKYYNQYAASYLSFIYRKGEWTEDFYDEISELTKLKNKGKIKTTHNTI